MVWWVFKREQVTRRDEFEESKNLGVRYKNKHSHEGVIQLRECECVMFCFLLLLLIHDDDDDDDDDLKWVKR